jgi:tetratricopeptide (TPR) repeat protein
MNNLKVRSYLLTLAIFGLSMSGVAQYSAQPSTNLPSQMPSETNRPVSITGQVVLEGGTPLSEPAAILRVCGSMVHREVVTASDGKFTVILNDTNANGTLQGASEGGGTNEFGARLGGGQVSQTTRTQLWGCELRASLAGYVSSSVSLAGKDFSTPINIGPIVLRKSGGGDSALSISAISAKAPEDAKKEYAKGLDEFSKKKYPEAEKHLAKAVEIYPQYAMAWDLRGREQRMQQLNKSAEDSFLAAIKADEKFIPPYLQLAGLYAANGLWEDTLRPAGKVIEIDPVHYPDAYFLNALALYNLQQLEPAETSARKAIESDKEHRYPRAELLLGWILQAKGDKPGAAEHYRAYLKLEPTTAEAPKIKAFLATANEKPKAN